MHWQINFWRVKCIQVWIDRDKGFMWCKNLLQFCPKFQTKCALCQADSAHCSRAVASETHGNNFLIFWSLFSQAFVLVSPVLRWEKSPRLMQEGRTSAGQSRIPAEASFCSTSSLPGAMASLRSIPSQHPTSALPASGAAQPQLHCTKDKDMKQPNTPDPGGHGVSVVIPETSARRVLCEPFLPDVKWSRLPLAGWLTAERLLMSISPPLLNGTSAGRESNSPGLNYPELFFALLKKVETLFRKVHKPTMHPTYKRRRKKKSLHEPIFYNKFHLSQLTLFWTSNRTNLHDKSWGGMGRNQGDGG